MESDNAGLEGHGQNDECKGPQSISLIRPSAADGGVISAATAGAKSEPLFGFSALDFIIGFLIPWTAFWLIGAVCAICIPDYSLSGGLVSGWHAGPVILRAMYDPLAFWPPFALGLAPWPILALKQRALHRALSVGLWAGTASASLMIIVPVIVGALVDLHSSGCGC